MRTISKDIHFHDKAEITFDHYIFDKTGTVIISYYGDGIEFRMEFWTFDELEEPVAMSLAPEDVGELELDAISDWIVYHALAYIKSYKYAQGIC